MSCLYIEELITHFQVVKQLSGNNHYVVRCPCHNDHKPSLDIVEKDGKIEAINLDFVIRIREYPKNKNGKKKSVVLD